MSLTARPATGSNRMATGWLLWLAIIVVSASDAPAVPQLEPREVEIIRERFLRVAEKFRELTGNSAFLPTLKDTDLDVLPGGGKRKEQIMAYALGGCVMIVDRDTHTMRAVKNAEIGDRMDAAYQATTAEERKQGLPRKQLQHRYYPKKLTPSEAVARARKYLAAFGFPIPAGFELHSVDFGTRSPGQWLVEWWPVIGGYEFDAEDGSLVPEVVVTFDETEGLVSAAWSDMPPIPANMTVKVTREEAMLKASRVAPLVFETPYYKRARFGGFVVASIFECDLRIAPPNYLLDPARAVWIDKCPPKETRLCWVVRLRTKPGTPELEAQALIPPDIVIYIDALTGEAVGANFS